MQDIIETAIGGQPVGLVMEGNRRFDLMLRFAAPYRENADAIRRILVSSPDGQRVPLDRLADIESLEDPIQIGREAGERRVVVQANVRGRDLGGSLRRRRRRWQSR